MTSRERLLRLASRGAALGTTRRVRLVSQLLLVAALVFVAMRLRSIWHDSHVDVGQVGWGWLAGAFALTACGVVSSGFIWLAILRRLGVRTRPAWAGILLQAQLSKYIPGTLWQYAGRAALGRARGIPVLAMGVSLPAELLASAFAAGIVSMLLLGVFGAVGAVIALCLTALDARRRSGGTLARLVRAVTGRDIAAAVNAAQRAVPLYVGTWLIIGSGFWLTARGLIHIPAGDIAVYIGAFSAAWVVGLVAVYAPGGLGVREAMLVAILRGRIGSADALVLAAGSRALITLVELGAAGAGMLLNRRSANTEAEKAVASDLPLEGA